jgi:hypothetical protein
MNQRPTIYNGEFFVSLTTFHVQSPVINKMSRKSKLAASSKAVDPTLAALFAESVSQSS